MALLARVMSMLTVWHPEITDVKCIQRVISQHFNNTSVQIIGTFAFDPTPGDRYEDKVPIGIYMDTIVKATMQTEKTVYIPGPYQPAIYQIAEVQYSKNGDLGLDLRVPWNTPVPTDFIYLPFSTKASSTKPLLQDIFPGPKALTGKSILLWDTKMEEGLRKTLKRIRLVDVVILIKETAYTYYMNDPRDCRLKRRQMHIVGSCTNMNSIFPPKTVKNFNYCFIYMRRTKSEKTCQPFGQNPLRKRIRAPETETLRAIYRVLHLKRKSYTYERWRKQWQALSSLRRVGYMSWMTDEYIDKMVNALQTKNLYDKEATGARDNIIDKLFPDVLPFWAHHVDLEYQCIGRHSEVAIADYDMGIVPTYSYGTDSLRWSVPAPHPAPQYYGIVRSFQMKVWVLIISSILFFTLTSGIIKKTSFTTAFFRNLAAMSQQAIRNSDFWDILFIYYALHVVTFYQASLLGNLSFKIMINDFKTVEEALANDGTLLETFQAYLYFYRERNKKVLDSFFRKDKLGLSLGETITIEDFKNEEYAGACRLQPNCSQPDTVFYQVTADLYKKKILPGVLSEVQYQFIMPPGHPLLPHVNKVIRWITESGLSNFWMSEQLHYMRMELKYKSDQPTIEKLNLSQLLSVFHLLTLLLIFSFMVFLYEVKKRYGFSIVPAIYLKVYGELLLRYNKFLCKFFLFLVLLVAVGFLIFLCEVQKIYRPRTRNQI